MIITMQRYASSVYAVVMHPSAVLNRNIAIRCDTEMPKKMPYLTTVQITYIAVDCRCQLCQFSHLLVIVCSDQYSVQH